jgi:UPF0755 protein
VIEYILCFLISSDMHKVIFNISLIFFISSILFFIFLISPTSLSNEKIRFVIPLDSKQEDVIVRLKNDYFIRSIRLFNIFAPLVHFPGTIEPGAYMLSHNMTLFSILDTLLKHPYQKWVLVKPGLRVEQVTEVIGDKLDWNDEKRKEFVSFSKEGYMFPDTYLLNVDYSAKDMANRLINNFNEKFDAQIQSDLLKNNLRNDTAIKIASLIERESGSLEDKPIIAGIILKRLNEGMKLQIDATIQYALGTPGNWWPKVSVQDYKLDSEYNTYVIKRLPPSPICSPSLDSIKAIASPAETDCLFYLHDHNMQIHCATTYQEHLENIEKFLK